MLKTHRPLSTVTEFDGVQIITKYPTLDEVLKVAQKLEEEHADFIMSIPRIRARANVEVKCVDNVCTYLSKLNRLTRAASDRYERCIQDSKTIDLKLSKEIRRLMKMLSSRIDDEHRALEATLTMLEAIEINVQIAALELKTKQQYEADPTTEPPAFREVCELLSQMPITPITLKYLTPVKEHKSRQ